MLRGGLEIGARPASTVMPATSASDRSRAWPNTRSRSTEGRVMPFSHLETVVWLNRSA